MLLLRHTKGISGSSSTNGPTRTPVMIAGFTIGTTTPKNLAIQRWENDYWDNHGSNTVTRPTQIVQTSIVSFAKNGHQTHTW